MSLSTLFAIYILSALVIFILLACWKKRTATLSNNHSLLNMWRKIHCQKVQSFFTMSTMWFSTVKKEQGRDDILGLNGVEIMSPLQLFSFCMIDFELSLVAILAFIAIGCGLAALILFTKAKLISSEECKIEVNNDPNLTAIVPTGMTLLNALTSHGIPIPSPCGGKATCKQCKVQVVEGAARSAGNR